MMQFIVGEDILRPVRNEVYNFLKESEEIMQK